MTKPLYYNIAPGGCIQRDLGLHRRDDGLLYYNAVNLSMSIPAAELPNYNTWSCDQWINFHKKLKGLYGRDDANQVWSGFFDNKPAGWQEDKVCTAQSYFISYFKKQGITFDDNVYTILGDAAGFLTSLPNTARTALIIGGVVVGVTVLSIIGYNIYRVVQISSSMGAARRKIMDNPELLIKAAMLK